MFAVSYSLLVSLVFEPPLPADAPADDAVWRAAHKASLLVATWLSFVLPADVVPRDQDAAGGPSGGGGGGGQSMFRAGRSFFAHYLPLVATLFLLVHVLMPLRACRRQRCVAGGFRGGATAANSTSPAAGGGKRRGETQRELQMV